MKDWWMGLELRERRMLSAAAIVVAAALLYALAWKPLHTAVTHTQEQVKDMRSELAWMNRAARLLESGGRKPAAQVTKLDGSLLDVIDQVTHAQGIGKDTVALSQKNDGQLQVKIKQIAFGRFVHWLDAVRNQQVKVISMHLTPAGHDIVSVSLRVGRP